MPGHESDEIRAYENEQMRSWMDEIPTRNEDYDNPSRDEEADAYHKHQMRAWLGRKPENNRRYDDRR